MEDVAITYLSPARFAAFRQLGLAIVQDWPGVARWLSTPSFAADKTAHGAWCPCTLPDGAVKGGRGPVSLLVADVDECTAGAIERTVGALSAYAGVVVPTFNATPEKPKHRIVLRVTRPIMPEEWALAWGKFAKVLGRLGIVGLDLGCKNINRLYFACVSRSPGRWMGAHELTGWPVDVDAMLIAAAADRRSEPKRVPRVAVDHPDRYIRRALQRAREAVDNASEGGRHDALLREAYSLARLNLSEAAIKDSLLEAFVFRAGEPRRREGERAIRDAVQARGAA